MAAQPTSPQTPTNPSPALTAAQARALLQTLLYTRPNPPPPRPTPNTTPTPASKPSTPQSKNQAPFSQQTITIDASTRIMGHANTINLPPNNIESIVRAALSHTKSTASQSSKPVNITIQTGINLTGSRNVVVYGSGSSSAASSIKDSGKTQQVETETDALGRKRRAESEPIVECRGGKKVKVEKE